MKRWLGIGLIGVTLLIAACGGDDDALSVEQYFDRLQTMAADRDAEADAIADPESIGETSSFFDEQADILDDSLDKVKDLNPPNDVAEFRFQKAAGLHAIRRHFVNAVVEFGQRLEERRMGQRQGAHLTPSCPPSTAMRASSSRTATSLNAAAIDSRCSDS